MSEKEERRYDVSFPYGDGVVFVTWKFTGTVDDAEDFSRRAQTFARAMMGTGDVEDAPALTGDPAKLAQLVREAIEAETVPELPDDAPAALRKMSRRVVDLDRLRARLPWLF